DLVDIGAEHDRADGAHQRAKPEHAEGVEQRGGLVLRGKERLGDGAGIEAEQEEVELLEEIAAGGAQDGAEARFDRRRLCGCGFRHELYFPRTKRRWFTEKASRQSTVSLMRQSATPAQRDQPEIARVRGLLPRGISGSVPCSGLVRSGFVLGRRSQP